MTPENFNTGDKVRHMSGTEGRVTKVDGAGVHVDFGQPGIRGIYDDRWFRMYPSGLEVLPQQTPGA